MYEEFCRICQCQRFISAKTDNCGSTIYMGVIKILIRCCFSDIHLNLKNNLITDLFCLLKFSLRFLILIYKSVKVFNPCPFINSIKSFNLKPETDKDTVTLIFYNMKSQHLPCV